MIKGGIKVSTSLDVKGKNVNSIMQWFHADSLIVNRRYQRKLVWSLEEKRLFIDSIINQYPTPSILVSSFVKEDLDGNTKTYYEIIDGLQRLNAIVSFVSNDFGIEIDGVEYFYDVQWIPTALHRKLTGDLQQREPILSYEICQDFANAELPVIITTQDGNRDKKIEQIFERINSSGRKLSAHDIRQSSSLGEFSDLVRRIAMDVRGDFTYSDEINLCDMPKISLRDRGLNYGIDPENSFWRKHDIMPFNNFRQSKDEEVIASAMAIVLLGKSFSISAKTLNSLYQPGNKTFSRVTDLISEIGKNTLEQNAKDVFRQIDSIFDSVQSNFTKYLYPKRSTAAKDVSFIALFCALYQLNRESYYVDDFKVVAETLKHNFNSTFGLLAKKSGNHVRSDVQDVLYNILKSVMVEKIPRVTTGDEKFVEMLLSLSPVESQMVEFKIGVTDFETGKLNEREITKILRTLVAMANTGRKGEAGFVIIGVANNQQSCSNWREIYSDIPLAYGSHYVVGVTPEAVRCFVDEDHYELQLKDIIKKSALSEPLKQYVLRNFKLIHFHDKVLVMLVSERQQDKSYYDGKSYVREGSSTVLEE